MWRLALHRDLLPWALQGVDLGEHVLEIGPGPGLTTDVLRKRVPKLTAIEVDPSLARALSERLRDTHATVVEADGSAMPFEDRTFSAVVALNMLHHVPSSMLQDRLFAEAFRTLRPNGVFIGMDNTSTALFRLIHIGDTLVDIEPAGLVERLRKAGFVRVAVDAGRRRFRFQAQRPDEMALSAGDNGVAPQEITA